MKEKMKSLSIIVPCYNSAAYMERCINSLLTGGEIVEIIIVNDGSKDQTASIADAYQAAFPTIIKVVHQENGGHGQAINSGLAVATGEFVKVVDSDDWVEHNAYRKILTILSEEVEAKEIDMLISNYVYEKENQKNKKIMNYHRFLPIGKTFSWEEVKFPFGKYLMMHSVIYRMDVLKETHLTLPKHSFYVDNLYIFEPLPKVEKMYYLDVDFYRYFIGRDDQSVNESVMISRINQQLTINKKMIGHYSMMEDAQVNTLDYMRRHLEIVTTISSILLIKEGSSESLAKKKELWQFIRQQDTQLYFRLRLGVLGFGLHLPGRLGRKTSIGVYRVAQRIYGFN